MLMDFYYDMLIDFCDGFVLMKLLMDFCSKLHFYSKTLLYFFLRLTYIYIYVMC
jgi:hypothetical protein